MKKALGSLIAVSLLATVAQAQFCYTGPITDVVRAKLVFTGADTARVVPAFATPGPLPEEVEVGATIVPHRGLPWTVAGIDKTTPRGSVRETPAAAPAPAGPVAATAEGNGAAAAMTLLFKPAELDGTDSIARWLVDDGTEMQLQGMLDSLEPEVPFTFELPEPEDGVGSSEEIRSAPEPGTFGLYGVMALLGIAVARRLSAN